MKREEIIKHLIQHGVLIKETRTDVKETREALKDLKDNHLFHLDKKLDKFYWVFIGGVITVLTAVIIAFIRLN